MKIRLKPPILPRLLPYVVFEPFSREYTTATYRHYFYGHSYNWRTKPDFQGIISHGFDPQMFNFYLFVPIGRTNFKLNYQKVGYDESVNYKSRKLNPFVGENSALWRVSDAKIEWPRLEIYANYIRFDQADYMPSIRRRLFFRPRHSLVLGSDFR